MAPRLQMKFGVAPAATRPPDAPDAILAIEPVVGSVARTKGQLYVLVTSSVAGGRVREATQLVAETIRTSYYYDESAGIQGCLAKAINAANRKLGHARERAALGSADRAVGPIGVALAVTRGTELYVATVGPAEAYLIRSARLSTLPDPHAERGLPAADLAPDVWKGEISIGDQLVLVSPNLMRTVGAEALNDAMVRLHPQAAAEELHARFVAGGGKGSDGIIAIEAAEVSQIRGGRSPVPLRPPEPLAGSPDRSPIPLADAVEGGVAAAQAGARRAGAAIGGAAGRLTRRLQDVLPQRRLSQQRIRPLSSRRETQRRAAMAAFAFLLVFGALGLGVYLVGEEVPGEVIASAETGQHALDLARQDLDRVDGPGLDLVADDPRKALKLLEDALAQLDIAAAAGIGEGTIRPLRARATAALERLYGVVEVAPQSVFTFPAEAGAHLAALVRGPDGAPYVLDDATGTVFRINVAEGTAVAIFREGQKASGAVEGAPRFLAVGGPDLLVLDAGNILWRWRPADDKGKGTTTQVRVNGSAEWGDDIRGIGTFLRNADQGVYNLYVVDPSAEQIMVYSPASDGSGFPAAATGRLATARDVSTFASLFIDGDIFVVDHGTIIRFVAGRDEGWAPEPPGDTLLRPDPSYGLVGSGTSRREGLLYGWDTRSARVIAVRKVDGRFVAQYRLTRADPGWRQVNGWYVEPGVGDLPDTLVWITATGLHRAVLEGRLATPSAPPDSAAPASAAPSPAASVP